jgi:hypothetical protein
MATNTYVALQTQTLTSAASSVTFSSINQGYTDLIIVANIKTSVNTNIWMQFNGDTTTTYSRTVLAGNGTSAVSARNSNIAKIYLDYYGYSNTGFENSKVVQIMNYSNSTTYKTALIRSNNASIGTDAIVGMWRNTAAITSIVLDADGVNFSIGSTFTLYGIAKQAIANTAKATGGTISYDAFGNVIHTFTASGTFTPSVPLTCDYLVVAGGGGGGNNRAGGGGAGGYRTGTGLALSATGYSVTVGAGGLSTSVGNDSVLSTITANGGGFGGTFAGSGGNGGSGGGGSGKTGGLSSPGGTGTVGQGNDGGIGGFSSGTRAGAGGGGASAAGANHNASIGGAGGAGTANSITGSSVTYAGGGGGSADTLANRGAGGAGGGGGGGYGATGGTAGTANTGGGGGGDYDTVGSNPGGSGIVIIRYPG